MLFLMRSVGESVILKDTRSGEVLAIVKITGILPNEVRIGFDAPKHIEIARDDARPRAPRVTTKGDVNGNA